MPFIAVAVGVDHGDLDTVDQANGVDAGLAVIEAVVLPLDGRAIEYAPCIFGGDSVPPKGGANSAWLPLADGGRLLSTPVRVPTVQGEQFIEQIGTYAKVRRFQPCQGRGEIDKAPPCGKIEYTECPDRREAA